jgi:hypothetical protein
MHGPPFSSIAHAGASVARHRHWTLRGAAPAASVLDALRRIAADATVVYVRGAHLPSALHEVLALHVEWSVYGEDSHPLVRNWRVRAAPEVWRTLTAFAGESPTAIEQLWLFRHHDPHAEWDGAAGGPLRLAAAVPEARVRRWARSLGLVVEFHEGSA